MNLFSYPVSPRLAAPTSVTAMISDVLIALVPALCMSIYLYGFQAFWLVMASMGFCVLFQWLYCLLFHREKPYFDASPWVTGLLLAFCYPADISLAAITVGSFVAIVVVKELYGGFGCNFLNPALAGRMFLASSPLLMSQFAPPRPILEANLVDAVSSATPLTQLQQGRLPSLTLPELFLGFHGGSMGEVSTGMLLLGGIYLLLRRVISPTIPLSYLGTVAMLTYLFPLGGQSPLEWMLYQLCSGGLVLGAFFMATDPVTSPASPRGQIAFGLGCGILTVLLRYYGSYPEGVAFAILTMNSLVWILDFVGRPRIFGDPILLRSKKAVRRFRQRIQNVQLPKNVPSSPPKAESQWLKGTICYGIVVSLCVGLIYNCYHATLFQRYRAMEDSKQALLSKAMPSATFMSETPYQSPIFSKLYLAYQDQDELGYCVEVTVCGFHGDITLLVGVDLGGAVTGIAVAEENETIIGDTALSDAIFRRFLGRSGTLGGDENSIDAVSGATVTFQAVVNAVNQALEVVQLIDQVGALELLDDAL